ncbi:MAG: TonB-dependent receptor plug domain-containing protein [Alphaproteobacteria bacterium]
MQSIYFLTLTSITTILVASSALAEPIFYQDATIEIANRNISKLSDTGATVHLIENKEIEEQQEHAASDILATIPGAYITTNGGYGQQANLSLRGLSSNYTKILFNGIDISDVSLTQPGYNFAYLPTSPLDRIEVARGNQSTLYGADAIAGVVNLQSFFDKETQGLFGKVGVMGGSFDTVNPYIHLGYNSQRAGISLYGDYFHTSGISAADKNNGNTEKDGYESGTFGFNTWFDINEYLTLEAGGQYLRAIAEYDGYDPITYVFGDANNNTSTRQYLGYSRLKGEGLVDGRLNFSLDLSAARTFRDYDDEAYAGINHSWYNSRKYAANFKSDFQFNDWLNLAAGGDVSYSEAQFRTPYDTSTFNHNMTDYALWSLATITPADGLNFTLGGRWQNNEIFGNKFTWRTTASYLIKPWGTRLHASAGTGFRAPSLYELYAPYYGEKTLKSENSKSYDFGIEQRLWNERIILDVTGFYNDVDNKINYNSATYKYYNGGRQKSYGVETSLAFKPIDRLELRTSYAYVKAYNPETHMNALNQPRHRLTSSATWQVTDKLKLGADIRAYSQRFTYVTNGSKELAGFATIDLRGEYAISEAISLKANITNLLDKDYTLVDSYSTQGFGAYVGLEASF